MITKKFIVVFFFIAIIVNLTSCAPSGYESDEAGFFSGIWHGIIFIFSLIGKLFGSDIGVYAENNTGFTYWLGFLIGLGCIGGGGYSAKR